MPTASVCRMLLIVLLASPFSYVVPLYDGARGVMPDQQGMIFLVNPPLGASASQSFADGVTTLDTTAARSDSAGYFGGSSVPVLDRAAGYSLLWTVAVPVERHEATDRNGDGIADRAGFSVIVLSSDKRGVELGFWTGRVWAQDDTRDSVSELFTQAEGAALDTTQRRDYELRIGGDTYTLLADDAPVLTGPLRDYTPFVGPIDPYETPNLVFLGDDSASADARVRLASVAVRIAGFGLALPVVGGS